MLSVLGIIIQLRKCCNHPNLFEPRPVVSPLVIPPLCPQFPAIAFPQQMDYSKPFDLVNTVSSQLSWDLFQQLLEQLNNSPVIAFSEEQKFPQIDKSIKFVADASGGHFYKTELGRLELTDGESAFNGDAGVSYYLIHAYVNIKFKFRIHTNTALNFWITGFENESFQLGRNHLSEFPRRISLKMQGLNSHQSGKQKWENAE